MKRYFYWIKLFNFRYGSRGWLLNYLLYGFTDCLVSITHKIIDSQIIHYNDLTLNYNIY